MNTLTFRKDNNIVTMDIKEIAVTKLVNSKPHTIIVDADDSFSEVLTRVNNMLELKEEEFIKLANVMKNNIDDNSLH